MPKIITNGDFRNCIRIGYGNKYDETIDYGLKLLGNLVKKMQK